MKKVTKLLSLLLAFVLVFSLGAASAYAEEAPKTEGKEIFTKLAEKFLEDPKGSIRKIDLAFTAVDIGEDVLSVLYHYDRMKDTFEDARFEADALRQKIRFDLDNIGKPDDPIGEAQLEIDLFIDREKHEGKQINEDIDNVNKALGLLGKLSGKDIPQLPAFEYEPWELELKPLIDNAITGLFK